MRDFLAGLSKYGFVGERRALALAALGFFGTMFVMLTLAMRSEMPEWVPAFAALATIYVVAFVAVAAEWFWGRWFAIGIGYSGLSTAAMAVFSLRDLPPPLVIYGVSHGLIAACLLGEKMVARYEAKPEWRARFGLNEEAVLRLRKSVIRAASSLPTLVLFALSPRQSGEMAILATVALAVGAIGVAGLVRLRTAGVFALGGAAIVTAMASVLTCPCDLASVDVATFSLTLSPAAFGFLSAALLSWAILPFIRPVTLALNARR